MAFSQRQSTSIRKGQIALVCQLCETEQKLKWKCIECGLMMCQRCQDKVHPKFPSAEDHNIIDIKDISQYQAEPGLKPDFTKLKCGVHHLKKCCLYCQSCDKLVCQTCIADTHNKRDFCEISDAYQNRVEKIRTEQENLKKELQTLTISRGKLRQVKSMGYKDYTKTKQEITAHEKALIDTKKKHTNKLLTELDQNWTNMSQSIDEEEIKVKKVEDRFREQNEIVDQILQTNDAESVFSESLIGSMKIKIQIPPINTVYDQIQKFDAGDIVNISKLYGKLKNANLPYNTGLNISQQYTTSLASIHNITSFPDGSLCINDLRSKVLQKVTPVGGTLAVISLVDLCVKDMALLPSGDLLLSIKDSSILKLVPSGTQEERDTPFNVSPLITTCVHVTTTNKVIIGTRDKGPVWPATGPRRVIVMDEIGQTEKIFQYDDYNNSLFTVPFRITSNNNIAVVDLISDDFTGRVVVLNTGGGVRNVYTGHPSINSNKNPFKPYGIVTTLSDNIVVADIDNHTLHVLSGEGDIITHYNTKEIGIEIPKSLTFNSIGQLYIGCDTYIYSEDPAKIFVVDNFVW